MALAAALSAQAPAEEPGWTSDEVLQELAVEAHRACSPPDSRPPDIRYALVHHAEWLAGFQQRINTPCRPRPRLALRIARAAAATRGMQAGYAYRLLARMYENGTGVARSPRAARDHLLRAWLLTDPRSMERPFATIAEADAFLARPDTIAFLRGHAGGPNMAFVRIRLARALLASGAPESAGEALALLAEPAARDYPESFYLLQRHRVETGDETQRALAIAALRTSARYGGFNRSDGGEARDFLAAYAQRQLAAAGTASERQEAIAVLADAAFALDSPHRTAFFRAVTEANGGTPPAMLDGAAARAARRRLRLSISDDDFPAAAMRAEEEGAVLLRGLIDPDGWLIYTEPAVSGQPSILLAHVRNLYARRRLPPVDRSAAPGTPYVWVALPVFFFSLSDPADE